MSLYLSIHLSIYIYTPIYTSTPDLVILAAFALGGEKWAFLMVENTYFRTGLAVPVFFLLIVWTTCSDTAVEAGSCKGPGEMKLRFSHSHAFLSPSANGAELLFRQNVVIQGTCAEMDSMRLRLQLLPLLVAPAVVYVPQVTWCAGEPPPTWSYLHLVGRIPCTNVI